MSLKLKYYHSLDGLRAVAALAVIIAHFFNESNVGNNQFILKITNLGNSGVSLFFVLSGFVITRILLNSRNSPFYFKTFYVRRILRIFPLYYFALLCYYYLPLLLNITQDIPSFRQQLYYWTYLQNFARTFAWNAVGPGHFWSLAVEEHFYLLWPAIIFLTFKQRLRNLEIFSIVLLFIPLFLRFIMLRKGLEINVFTFTRLDQLTLGGILAIVEKKGFLQKKQFKYFLMLFIFGLFFVAYVSSLNYFSLNLFKHYAFGVTYFGLIGMSAIGSRTMILNRFLSLSVMQYLGKISYGIYVWHVLAIEIVNNYFLTNIIIIDFLIVVILTILISSLSFKYLEKPFLNLKRYFAYNEVSASTVKVIR